MPLPSDEFFRQNTRKYDIIFIDGDHDCNQAYRDVENALAALNKGGMVIIHDALPPSESFTKIEDKAANQGNWTGDVWKSVLRLFAGSPFLCYVVDTDWGVAIIDTAHACRDTEGESISPSHLDYSRHFHLLQRYRVSIGEFLQMNPLGVSKSNGYTMPLLMTGAVYPSCRVARKDPEVRMADYRSAMFLWLTQSPFQNIQYLDASGASVLTPALIALAKHLNKTVTEHSLNLAEVTRKHGKGRAEAMLINHAAAHVQGCFFKVTGRCFVLNNHELTRQSDPNIFNINPLGVDTRFFKADAKWFLENLSPRTPRICDNNRSTYIERIYSEQNPAATWYIPPKFYGVRGTSGRSL